MHFSLSSQRSWSYSWKHFVIFGCKVALFSWTCVQRMVQSHLRWDVMEKINRKNGPYRSVMEGPGRKKGVVSSRKLWQTQVDPESVFATLSSETLNIFYCSIVEIFWRYFNSFSKKSYIKNLLMKIWTTFLVKVWMDTPDPPWHHICNSIKRTML